MVSWLLRHRVMMSIVAYFLVALMLCSTVSPFSQKAEATGEAVGMGLIIAILNAFGITVSSSGAIAGMTSGLSDLMEQFSEQMYDNAQHFKDLFSAHITMAGWGIAKIGNVLTEAITDFISWLKSDNSLSVSSPIVFSNPSSIVVNDINYYAPLISNVIVTIPAGVSGTYNIGGGHYYKTVVNGRETTYYHIYNNSETYLMSIGGLLDSGVYYTVNNNAISFYLGLYDQKWYLSQSLIFIIYGNISDTVSGDSWVINDDNLDLSFLENDDESTKDVYFSPALPDIVGQDLSTVGGISDAADQQLIYTYDLTGTAEIAGTMDITSDLEPGSGGSGNVPPIIIPSGGWFSSIWHYVVKALQDSAQGVAFIMQLVTEFIPPQLLNLCWASAVLCITFGIVNKFLK